MLPWIAIMIAAASMPAGLVEAGGVRIEVAIRSHVYTWTVTNLSAEPIDRFEIDQYGASVQTAPNGWTYELDGPRWRTWADEPRYAIGVGQSLEFHTRVKSTGAVLGTVPAIVRFVGDVEPVRFEHVWGPRPRRISMVVLVAIGVATIAGIHTVMLERRSRRNRSTP